MPHSAVQSSCRSGFITASQTGPFSRVPQVAPAIPSGRPAASGDAPLGYVCRLMLGRPGAGNATPVTRSAGKSSTSGDLGRRRGKNTYAGWRTPLGGAQSVGRRNGGGSMRNTATRSIPTTGFRRGCLCASRESSQRSTPGFSLSPAARF